MNPYAGYGRVEIGLARAFEALGVDLKLAPASWMPTLVCGNAEWLAAPQMAGRSLYLYTMSESDRVSERWVELINQHAAGVFVPCADLVQVYRDSGVLVPVHDVGLGMDLFTVDYQQWGKREAAGKPFTFLGYSLGDMRKGAELTIMAFLQCFKDDPDYRLIIKARDGWNNSWLAGLDEPQVEIVGKVQSNAEWDDLLRRADCFVFPSKGEGFGMPPREATLAGVPTIATQWLGMADVANWGLPLMVDRMQRCTFDTYGANADGAKWALPSLEHLKASMRWVVDNYADAVEIADQGGVYLMQNCTWERVAKRIMGVMHGSDA